MFFVNLLWAFFFSKNLRFRNVLEMVVFIIRWILPRVFPRPWRPVKSYHRTCLATMVVGLDSAALAAAAGFPRLGERKYSQWLKVG